MATKHIFPLMLEGTFTTTGAHTWGSSVATTVGMMVMATGSDSVAFNSTTNPADEAGSVVVCHNTHSGALNVTIAPDPNGDATSDTIAVPAGAFLTVMYHPTHGWIPLGGTGATVPS